MPEVKRKLPEAIRLAHWLEREGADCQQHVDAASELRRLHAVSTELLAALKGLLDDVDQLADEFSICAEISTSSYGRRARTALAGYKQTTRGTQNGS